MNKLNTTFKINPLYESDGYKVAHKAMLAKDTTRLYGTWIPRSLKYMPRGIDKIMSAGQQLVVRYLHSTFAENFFFTKELEFVKNSNTTEDEFYYKQEAMKFISDMSKYLGMKYEGKHFEDLWDLGYLPIKIKAIPEGIFTQPNIPHMTFINTVDGYAWLTLFLETYISKLAWQMPTAATIANKFKQNSIEWVNKTDKNNLWLADFMCHDFHSRGGNPFTSIAVGLGHSISNKGSDTLNVIPASRYYYDFDENEVPIFSVNASEHSVSCTQLFYYADQLKNGLLNDKIKEFYSFDLPADGSVNNPDYLTIAEWLMLDDWLDRFPNGILSVVDDTMSTWKHITQVIARLKNKILVRNGKLVTRPDSGDPVDIICGVNPEFGYSEDKDVAQNKGVIELLWNIFGGTINEQGYKVLDQHIGAIYGDSINLDRQVEIYKRLEAKGFAATNIVLGVGSFTYVMLTRDSAGYAAKGSWFEVEEDRTHNDNGRETQWTEKVSYNIYKDPITDDGQKRSLKGLLCVTQNEHNGELEVIQECDWNLENKGMLQTIYENGEFYNQTTLTEIRQRINNIL
jgi:nicotinamide phosphoribosyltransferase